MYSYVDKKGLHCGYDNSTNLSLVEIRSGDIKMHSIICNDHRKSGNHVCDLNSLKTFITEYCTRHSLTKQAAIEIVNTICEQISTDKIRINYDQEKMDFYFI
ncbi:hypothetical protein ACNQFZ_18595 [Schinkia sp. CFF1]